MKMRSVVICAAMYVLVAANALADASIASVQQKLKDNGFYYGAISGQKDADTTAAIRRYQIRNGLKVTGDLNPETQKSLGMKGSPVAPAPSATPARFATPPPAAPRPSVAPQTTDLRDPTPPIKYAPGPRGIAPEMSGVFDGTPYEVAPPDLQRRVLVGAQTLLARRGYYRGATDGVYGPGMSFALRAFQTRFELEPNGRLDLQTLGALGLLPGQQAPGVTAPRRRSISRPRMMTPGGEPVYEPR
ncbi:MAG: peptidoglycan-binding protein [Verrucomicrobiota bacterium]|nr:peptidoglycan-binding protein [Verrucomicrobiota bacterium]